MIGVSHDMSRDVSHDPGVHPKLLEAFSLKPQPPVSTKFIVHVGTQTFTYKTIIFCSLFLLCVSICIHRNITSRVSSLYTSTILVLFSDTFCYFCYFLLL